MHNAWLVFRRRKFIERALTEQLEGETRVEAFLPLGHRRRHRVAMRLSASVSTRRQAESTYVPDDIVAQAFNDWSRQSLSIVLRTNSEDYNTEQYTYTVLSW